MRRFANPEDLFLHFGEPLIAAFDRQITSCNHHPDGSAPHHSEKQLRQVVKSLASFDLQNDPKIFAPAETQTNGDGDRFECRWAPRIVPVVSEPLVKGGQGYADAEMPVKAEPLVTLDWGTFGLWLGMIIVMVATVWVVAWSIVRHLH